MTQKSAKKKSKKTAKSGGDQSVLGTLPSTRPTRIGGGRRAAKPAAKSSARATKSSPAAATTQSSARATTAKPKKAPKSPIAATQRKATAAQRPAAPPPPPHHDDGRPGAVTTAVQAVGELAQIGATVGSQLLKRAAKRIPRP
jgi:hypothetical protein